MTSLLSKLSGTKKVVPIEPREIFMALPQKDKRYEYPRDVQSEVWKKWYDVRDNKNNIIKMNTGSGKTVVGLLILQSCLNEGKGPAVYIVPDKFLCSQVCEEAKNLNILVTEDKDSYLYTEKKAILVTTIHAIVNGRSAFGMRRNNNYPIGSILLDDVHACLDIISTQFSIKIPYDHDAYGKLIHIFENEWKAYNNAAYIDIIEKKDRSNRFIMPFWIWQKKCNDVYSILSNYNNDSEDNCCVYFNLPLLVDVLPTCDFFVSASEIEIIPEGIPISKIKSFADAYRRIFMSATLSDDSVFVSAVGLNTEEKIDIITPDNANDIGDRLILFPSHLNNEVTDDEIKNKVFAISQKYNVVVIVPSFERAKYWDENGEKTVYKENIENTVNQLKNSHIGLRIFVNRYDGVDLPDNACRMLVIDGLPPLRTAKEKYIESIDSNCSILMHEQIQRIEQGMGRGVRSNSDSCCIILMGEDLTNVLLRNDGISFFSNATREQYNLSKDLWELLIQENAKPTIDDIFELANYSLNREIEWIQHSKERLSSIKYSKKPQFDMNAIQLRKAFDFSIIMQNQKSIDSIDIAINNEKSNSTKGYLMQVKAKYTNLTDELKAQQILLSGRSLNTGVIPPLKGIIFDKSLRSLKQSKAICEYIEKNKFNQNEYVLHIDDILSKFSFSQKYNEFELSLHKIGEIIGFKSLRLDKETGGSGPDNLWIISENTCLIIECKNEAICNTISKDNCNQLAGSIRWFKDEYGDNYDCIPVIVHKSNIVDKAATAIDNMKIINEKKLDKLKNKLNDFAIAVSQNINWKDEEKIDLLLKQYVLRGCDICNQYTVSYVCE